MIKKLISTLTILSICSVANAITWDFTTGGKNGNPIDIWDTTDTYKVTASGNAKVTWNKKGLGIKGGRNGQIDDKGINDILYLDLHTSLFVKEFEIRQQDGNDSAIWKLDGGSWINEGVVANNTPISINQVGQRISFTAKGPGKQGYRVSKLVAYLGDANVTRVPDSGTTLSLLGLALIGVFFARKRQSK